MSSLKLYGSSSGYTEIVPSSVAGNNSITLPTTGGTVSTLDTSGRLLVGTSSARTTVPTISPWIQLEGTDNARVMSIISDDSTVGNGGVIQLGHQLSGTVGGNTAVTDNTQIGGFSFIGNDGTGFVQGAFIRSEVDGTPGTNDMPGRLVFGTTADGSSAGTERMRITNAGNIGIGVTGPGALLHIAEVAAVSGFSSTSLRITRSNYGADFTGYIDQGVGSGAIISTVEAGTATERVRITNAGRVGIGTANPAWPLVVEKNQDTSTVLQVRNANTGVNAGSFVQLVSGDTAYTNISCRVNGSYFAIQGSLITTQYQDFDTHIWRTNAGTERTRIDPSGRLLVGTSTSIVEQYSGNARFQVATGGSYAIGAFSYTNDVNECVLTLGKSRSITTGNHTVVQNGDSLGGLRFEGSDGTGFISAAFITAQVDGTPGTNDMPGRIVLSTTPDGTATPVEQWRINNAGTVIYNQPAPAAVNTTATLTVANLTAKIITSTTAAAVTMTLPLGTDMDTGFNSLYTNMAFEWYVINTGATNAVTVQANTGHTIVGSATVAASNSGKFLSRRTAANTWVTYRLSS